MVMVNELEFELVRISKMSRCTRHLLNPAPHDQKLFLPVREETNMLK